MIPGLENPFDYFLKMREARMGHDRVMSSNHRHGAMYLAFLVTMPINSELYESTVQTIDFCSTVGMTSSDLQRMISGHWNRRYGPGAFKTAASSAVAASVAIAIDSVQSAFPNCS